MKSRFIFFFFAAVLSCYTNAMRDIRGKGGKGKFEGYQRDYVKDHRKQRQQQRHANKKLTTRTRGGASKKPYVTTFVGIKREEAQSLFQNSKKKKKSSPSISPRHFFAAFFSFSGDSATIGGR
jgi:hypothetical protein